MEIDLDTEQLKLLHDSIREIRFRLSLEDDIDQELHNILNIIKETLD